MQASGGFGWAASSSEDDGEDTSDADEWDCGEEDGGRGVAVLRRLPGRSAPSPVGSTHGHSSTEDEPLDDTGSDSEEDMEESRRLKWKRCRRHRPPMMEMWAAVRESLLPTPASSCICRPQAHQKHLPARGVGRFRRQPP
eukprot:COSAG03_NODE_812_length_5759_cov_19.856007_5_plen_140_part_00